MTHRTPNDVLDEIDSYFGQPTKRASAAAGPTATPTAQAAERNGRVLHLMWDTSSNSFVGASIAGQLLSGVVAAHLSKDGVSLLNCDGENLLGTKAVASDEDSRATATSRLQQDVLSFLTEGDEA
jgi:hypothetical protein